MTPSSAEGGGLALPLSYGEHDGYYYVFDTREMHVATVDIEAHAVLLVTAANHFPALLALVERIEQIMSRYHRVSDREVGELLPDLRQVLAAVREGEK